MFKNKKGLSWIIVVLLIVSLTAFIVIFLYSTNIIGQSTYESDILKCSILFSQIQGKPKFFSNELDEPTLEFERLTSNSCPSKDIKITENSAKNSAELVQDCWAKTGKGVDFFGANTNDLSICVYCGRIQSKDNIEDFNSKFNEIIIDEKYQSLFEETEIINSNENFIKNPSNIPSKVNQDTSIGVFYFAYKPKIECLSDEGFSFTGCKEKLQISFSKFVGNFGGWFTTGAYLTSSGEESYRPTTGILLGSIDENKENKFVENSVPIGDKGDKQLECDLLIVPNDNYE
jgi:hypothetical protein